MSLAETILEMNQYCEVPDIARQLQIPLEIVEGVLNNTVDVTALEGYDPSKPPELKLIKEDGVKIIEQKLEQLTKQPRKTKKKAKSLWNLTLDIVWLLALFISLSASAWVVYYVGQQVGFEHPWLTNYATFLESFVKGLK